MKVSKIFLLILISFNTIENFAKTKPNLPFVSNDIFQTKYFIENRGQFDGQNTQNSKTKFAVDCGEDHIYFNLSGLVWDLRKFEKLDTSNEDQENTKEKHREADENIKMTHERIQMNWINSNPICHLEGENKSQHYFTYGDIRYKSFGYKKIIYKNLYPNIDVEYIIPKLGGIKYSLILHPGAHLEEVKFNYSGDQVDIKIDENKLLIRNSIRDLIETNLNVFYEDGSNIQCRYKVLNDGIGFEFKEPIDHTKKIIVDPWVTQLNFISSGGGNDFGLDVDYDYQGNLYVYGVNLTTSDAKMSKYTDAGVLLWTFGGAIVSPAWNANSTTNAVGNFVVDKLNSKSYLGQGLSYTGTQIIRLDANGFYDNFISTANMNFEEVWEMNFDCNTGNVLGMGGGSAGDINIGVVNSAGAFASANLTGVIDPHQDILSSTVTSKGDLYVAMVSLVTPALDNAIIKVNSTLNGNSWIVSTGFNSFVEPFNKPYLGNLSNGFNALHANDSYLFYYDGFNVAAFSEINGSSIGNTFNFPSFQLKFQGGIYADKCNHIYVGGDNGNIKVLHFDGTNFHALPDIFLPGLSGRHVYDIKYNSAKDLLYVCGEGFVATTSKSQVCIDTVSINVSLNSDCEKASAQIINGDPLSLYSYIWTDSTSNTVVKSTLNSTQQIDSLLHLTPGHIYHVFVAANAACGGASRVLRFEVGNIDSSSQTIEMCKGKSYTINNHTYTETGVYKDTVLNASGCKSMMTTTIKIDETAESTFFIANVFTPNDDHLNDCFGVDYWKNIEHFEFMIYDRWGEAIFVAKDKKDCWDGTFKGMKSELGVYFYYINVTTSCGNHIFKGDITLMR